MDVLTAAPLPLTAWLAVVEREYLSEFVPAGGASVKIAILDAGLIAHAATALAARAPVHRLLPVHIDAARTRLHMMHDLLFAITRALPWDALVQGYLENLFAANAYAWPRPGEAMSINALAAAFGVAPALLARNRDQWLTADLWDDRGLAQDFRAALLLLCRSRLDPDGADAVQPVLQWLTGEAVPAPLLRAADISGRITRTTARAMLTSVCRFAQRGSFSGLLVTLDARALSGGGGEGGLRYSTAAVMDTYEVLRELIDDGEHLPGLFVAMLADPPLATGDPRRAIGSYAALQMRVWPDVRPGDRQNPVAPLVWLS